jgi:phosphate transport system protein
MYEFTAGKASPQSVTPTRKIGMQQHLHREVDQLKKRILQLGAVVEESVYDAVRSITEQDPALADRVLEIDRQVDQTEVDIEEDCLQILALYQPVASDLRFIVAVLKLNNDLERIGDLAANLAHVAKRMSKADAAKPPFDVQTMGAKVQQMLKGALDALVNLDPDLARQICAADEEVDELHRSVYARVQERIQADPSEAGALIRYITISRHLERIADHATNIAEDVLYTVEGKILRHTI